MLCEECHERPATVHVVTQINGHKSEKWICEECARSHQELQTFGFNPQSAVFAFQNLLSSLFDAERSGLGNAAASQPRSRAARSDRCEVCGTTLADFRRTGLLGCAHCYRQFSGPLESVIRRVQGGNTHRGRRPQGAVTPAPAGKARGGAAPTTAAATPEATDRAAQIARLREEMRQAVAEERYEEAARLRDEIHRLEQEEHAKQEPSAGRGPQRTV